MKNLILGFIAGVVLAVSGSALAKGIIGPYMNPLFAPIDEITGEVYAEKGSVVYDQRQKDLTIIYGRLDYMVNQLNQLQNTCSKR